MDKAQQLRWAILLLALAATLVAIFYPQEQDDAAPQVRRVAHMPAPGRAAASAATPEPQLAWLASESDPFSAKGWTPVVALAPATAPAAQPLVVAPVEAGPAPAPPLPFKFVGQMVDGADRLVYLGLGEQVLLARVGDVLEGIYKVTAITPAQIEFELTAGGAHQALPLPAQDR